MAEEVLIDPLIVEGATLMLLGMATVFAFLTLLVVMTHLMSVVLRRFEREPESPVDEELADELVAAVTAVVRHRSLHGR